MKPILGLIVLAIPAAGTASPTPEPHTLASTRGVHWVTVDDEITSVTSRLIKRSLKLAEDDGGALVIQLDTPGGSLPATWDIVETELNAKVPVVVWVAPRGAHAGSAGVYITLAANIAAMAPGSRIGSAHPVVSIGQFFWPPPPSETPSPGSSPATAPTPPLPVGTPEWMENSRHLAQKLQNDTLSWADSIAEQRARNKQWLRDAVLKSISSTAEEALSKNVVDLLADNREDLLSKLDGRTVKTASGEVILHTASASVVDEKMTFPEKFLALLADPTVMFLLMVVAALGIYVEFNNPGMIAPAVIGGLAAVAFLIAAQVVPINVAGLLLIALGILCFVLELKFHSYLVLTTSGMVCIILGLALMVDPSKFTVGVKWTVVLPAMLALAGIMVGMAVLAVKAMQTAPLGDEREMVGRLVRVSAPLGGETGTVLVDGVLWKAVCSTPVGAGETVRIVAAKGLTLTVVPDREPRPSAPQPSG